MDEKNKRSEKKWKWYVLERKSVSLLIVLLIAILFYVGLNHVDVIAVRVRPAHRLQGWAGIQRRGGV